MCLRRIIYFSLSVFILKLQWFYRRHRIRASPDAEPTFQTLRGRIGGTIEFFFKFIRILGLQPPVIPHIVRDGGIGGSLPNITYI